MDMKRLVLTLACVIIAGMSFANHWTPIGGTQYNMTISGIILIDGMEQTGTTLEVGAFCGDECRGSMLPEFFPPTAQYVVALTVVSNQLSGEEITFRLYDHATQQELDQVSVNDITFENNAIIGTLGNWYEFSFEYVESGENHWTPIGGTQYSMTMNGIILIDGVEQTGTNLEVGAFCGNECRGSMKPEFFPPSAQYVVALTVVSNQLSGEEITFRLYDHYTHRELDLVSVNTITFESNAMIGTLGEWFEFSFINSLSTQTIVLSAGVNWCSFYVETSLSDVENALSDAFPNIQNNQVLQIQSQTKNVKWTRGQWRGELSSLDFAQSYMITVPSDCEITVEGMPLNPAAYSITLAPASSMGSGTSWIGYPVNAEMTLNNAFGSSLPVNGDIVQSQLLNTVRTRGQWRGELGTLQPGQGYMYQSASTTERTFTFPSNNKASTPGNATSH
jgi:hypothetical protein